MTQAKQMLKDMYPDFSDAEIELLLELRKDFWQ